MSYITEVGIDQEWDKVFFNLLFSYHFTILVQGPEIFFFIFCDISHLNSQHEHKAQLVRSETGDRRQPLGGFQWLNGASWWPNWKPSCNICECGRLCFDQRFGSILFLAHFIVLCGYTQNPESCFLGKYWNSGLKSPSESLEPEVTLSQSYNAHWLQSRLLAAKFTAGTHPYTLRFTISTHFQVVLFLFS